jgi:hypothetical protein
MKAIAQHETLMSWFENRQFFGKSFHGKIKINIASINSHFSFKNRERLRNFTFSNIYTEQLDILDDGISTTLGVVTRHEQS